MRAFVDTSGWRALFDRDDEKHRDAVQMVDINRARFDQAWEMFQRFDDKEYSFTDVTSFLLIGEHRCDSVFAFDIHFDQAGFRLLRAQ